MRNVLTLKGICEAVSFRTPSDKDTPADIPFRESLVNNESILYKRNLIKLAKVLFFMVILLAQIDSDYFSDLTGEYLFLLILLFFFSPAPLTLEGEACPPRYGTAIAPQNGKIRGVRRCLIDTVISFPLTKETKSVIHL